mmetsp:Transcript_22428/g.29086  ORF Transcript_22428/g.29086 Transcript_22428/m.29086 type:complete len:114 (-) Transcript_22428:1381-1722(-)
MDSSFLKETVGAPLIEALTSMAVEQPSDSVEYIGNYLLNYVERKKKELKLEEAKAQVEELLQEAKQEEMARLEEQQVHQKAADEIEQKKKKNYKENARNNFSRKCFLRGIDIR